MDKPLGASDACRERRFPPPRSRVPPQRRPPVLPAWQRAEGSVPRTGGRRHLRPSRGGPTAGAWVDAPVDTSDGKPGKVPPRPLATPSHCLEGGLATGVFTFATWPCPGSRGGTFRVATGAANPAPAWPPWTEGLGPPVSQKALVQVTRGLLAALAETGLPVLGVPENACISLLFV